MPNVGVFSSVTVTITSLMLEINLFEEGDFTVLYMFKITLFRENNYVLSLKGKRTSLLSNTENFFYISRGNDVASNGISTVISVPTKERLF